MMNIYFEFFTTGKHILAKLEKYFMKNNADSLAGNITAPI